jgi:tetratricopeptide (TPR) repeat protein
MAPVPDPFASYLKRADDLFSKGDIVQAGQIWQAILKKNPGHEAARAGLYKVKLYFDARATQDGLVVPVPSGAAPAQAVPPEDDVRATQAPAPQVDPEVTRLLEQGCTLYDAGHAEDALTKWVQVLARDPGNVLAKGYIEGARRTLGTPAPDPAPAPSQPAPQPVPQPAPEPEEDVERLLRDGCTLFDMGQPEDALKKWEQILARDPAHVLARAYVQDARRELGLPPLEEGARPAIPVPAAPEVSGPAPSGEADEALERLIREGVQLYDMGMVQEATGKWQQVLAQSPGHAEAEAYLAMAKKDQAAQSPTAPSRAAEAPVAAPAPQPPPSPRKAAVPLQLDIELPARPVQEPVTPPAAVTATPSKPRKGLNLPDLLSGISLPAWMASPVFILGTIGGLVIVVVGSYYYLQHRKDKALEEAVAAFRASAIQPVARDSEVAKLEETPAEIGREARSALDSDPLLAYYRAKELLRLNPGDSTSAQLLEQAKAGLAKEAGETATAADLDRQLRNRDLEGADRTLAALLARNPDDAVLREHAARLHGALAEAFAAKEHWSDAEAQLRMGRAMFPEDASWNLRLRLLERLQSMSGAERKQWVPFLQ